MSLKNEQILNVLVKAGAASSNREARQFVKGGSVLVNGEKVTDEKFVVSKDNAFGGKVTVIRRGKKEVTSLLIISKQTVVCLFLGRM